MTTQPTQKAVLLQVYHITSLSGTGHRAKLVTTHTYELYIDAGSLRTIRTLEKTEMGRRKTFRSKKQVMDLEDGRYVQEEDWQDILPKHAVAIIKEWSSIPAKETFKNHYGSTTGETRYFA